MKAYIVYGDHFRVPGRSTSVHLSMDSASRAAGDLVNLLVADIRDDNDSDLGIPDVVDGKDWSGILQRAQVTRVADIADMETLQALEKGEPPYGYGSYEDALAEISECDVWIEEHEIVGGEAAATAALSVMWSQAMADRFKALEGLTGVAITSPWDVHLLIVGYEEGGAFHEESVALLANSCSRDMGTHTLAQRAGDVIQSRGKDRKIKSVVGKGMVLLKHRKHFLLRASRDGDFEEMRISASNIEEARQAVFHHLTGYFRIDVETITSAYCEEDWDFLAAECDYCTLEEVA